MLMLDKVSTRMFLFVVLGAIPASSSGLALDTRPSSYASADPVVSGRISIDTRNGVLPRAGDGAVSSSCRLDTRTAVHRIATGQAEGVVLSGDWIPGVSQGEAVVTAARVENVSPVSFHDAVPVTGGESEVLARRKGQGSFSWQPERRGVWLLSHETETNGVSCGEPLRAWFRFPAPSVSILATGPVRKGVTISLAASEPDWSVRYTVDGSDPTTESTEYAEPFPIEKTTTVRAVAVSANGDVGDPVSRTFLIYNAPSGTEVEPVLSSVSARQRYPWNGKVDVDVTFAGRDVENYRIGLSALDLDGGTNLPVRTVWLETLPDRTGNPVEVPAPGTHRLVWDADADLPEGFVADRVAVSAELFNPVWSFDSIPEADSSDEWAPATVYHDVQTVVARGEIENHEPTVRCLTDEWNLEASLGANVVFSGASMGLRKADAAMRNRGVDFPISLWTHSDATNAYRMVTMDYRTGVIAYDSPYAFSIPGSDLRFFQMRDGGGRSFADLCRDGAGDVFLKSANTDRSIATMDCRHADAVHGSAVCGYFPNGIPVSDDSATGVSSFDKSVNAAVFFSGEAGTDMKEAVVLCGGSAGIRETSAHSCMGNPVGRYVVPLLDGNAFFTVACGDGSEFVPQNFRWALGRFDGHGTWQYLSDPDDGRGNRVAESKAVAMPDGKRVFLGGVGRREDGRLRIWNGTAAPNEFECYPAGHPFESWARRDVTCLLPNGKFCGVDEELGLVVVNPLTGETYVASDDPVFKKGKMGCQLLPNGKVWIIPYDCEGREFEAGLDLCGKLYEVDFGFSRSFSLSSLLSPYLKVAEGDPEPSGVKVGLDPNGGQLSGIHAMYYKDANPVYGELPIPVLDGRTFLGWSADGTAETIVENDNPVPNDGIRLTAIWEQ